MIWNVNPSIEEKIKDWIHLALAHNNMLFLEKSIHVEFHDVLERERPNVIGFVRLENNTIYLSNFYWKLFNNKERFEVIIHEVAHLVAHYKYNDKSHDDFWKECVRNSGGTPQNHFSFKQHFCNDHSINAYFE